MAVPRPQTEGSVRNRRGVGTRPSDAAASLGAHADGPTAGPGDAQPPPGSVSRMQQTTARRTVLAAALAAASIALAGCSAGGGHDVGDTVSTKLNGSTFDGHLGLTVTKVERATNGAMRQFGLSSKGDDAYLAHVTATVVDGSFPASATKDLGNRAWGLRADDRLQSGPALAASDRNETLQDACPYDADAIAAKLRSGRTAELCAVLLAPKGSTVSGVSYLRAAPTDEGAEGDATVTWRSAE